MTLWTLPVLTHWTSFMYVYLSPYNFVNAEVWSWISGLHRIFIEFSSTVSEKKSLWIIKKKKKIQQRRDYCRVLLIRRSTFCQKVKVYKCQKNLFVCNLNIIYLIELATIRYSDFSIHQMDGWYAKDSSGYFKAPEQKSH